MSICAQLCKISHPHWNKSNAELPTFESQFKVSLIYLSVIFIFYKLLFYQPIDDITLVGTQILGSLRTSPKAL